MAPAFCDTKCEFFSSEAVGSQPAEAVRAGELQARRVSVERLMTFLTALDQDAEIVITKKPE